MEVYVKTLQHNYNKQVWSWGTVTVYADKIQLDSRIIAGKILKALDAFQSVRKPF